MILLELPIPPTINHYYCPKQGSYSKYLSDKTKAFRRDVYYLYRANSKRIAFNDNECLQVYIKFIFDNARANDIDNRIKPLLDALTHAGCFTDDKYIFRLIVDKEIDKTLKESKCLVEISKIA